MGRRPPAFAVRAALQLQMIAPSSPLSHSGSDLQLSEFFISLQSLTPMQAHLTHSPGVAQQLNSAPRHSLAASREHGLPRLHSELDRRQLSLVSPIHLAQQYLSRSNGIAHPPVCFREAR